MTLSIHGLLQSLDRSDSAASIVRAHFLDRRKAVVVLVNVREDSRLWILVTRQLAVMVSIRVLEGLQESATSPGAAAPSSAPYRLELPTWFGVPRVLANPLGGHHTFFPLEKSCLQLLEFRRIHACKVPLFADIITKVKKHWRTVAGAVDQFPVAHPCGMLSAASPEQLVMRATFGLAGDKRD
jgi:hypothetical protein